MATSSPTLSKPLVAVITPVYNGEKHFEAALQAVQAQTYRPLVHCIVDNASTDGTPALIAKYSNGPVPIITIRNPETITFQQNSNMAVSIIPPEATHFRMFHADDEMPPTAIADMMELALQGDDIVLVSGGERMNGIDRPHNFPPECSIYEASNMLARVLSDEAHIPTAHVLIRTDAIRPDEEFYPTDTIECYIFAAWRTLSRGGRAGFVHAYNADTRRYAGSGSMVDTLAPVIKAVLWEKLLMIERWGPGALCNTEYKRVHGRFLRVYYRRLLYWALSGHMDKVKRDMARLATRGHHPNVLDMIIGAAVWPYYLFLKRVFKAPAPPRWPADATNAGTNRAPGLAPSALREVKSSKR
jgi:glycosyltransferase involved in cell wall biosynthesis